MSNDEVRTDVFDEGEPAPTRVESLKELLQSKGPQRLIEIDADLDSHRISVKLLRSVIAELVAERTDLVRILNATTRRTNRKPTVDTAPAPKPARVRKPKPVTSDGD